MNISYSRNYLEQTRSVAEQVDTVHVDRMVEGLRYLRDQGGRLFLLGVGGSAANASHAVNDFRKICGFEAYTPTDNVSELSARINDEGWESSFAAWLKASRFNAKDGLFVLSVGGGSPEKNVSMNLVAALRYAKELGAKTFGIVGRDGGYTKQVADCCVVVPTVDPSLVTFHSESFQSVILHLIVSHPDLKTEPTKWEALEK